MGMARVGGQRLIRGEARVTYLKPKYAVLSRPGLDGGIFLVPSSIMGQQKGYPDMGTMIHLNDIVKFEAVPQEEKNGIKWQALDGSVSMLKRAEDVEWRDSGTISFLDDRTGQFGFIEGSKGSVWFNANVVRPESRDVTRAFKKGQQVLFVAIENPTPKNQCRYRATLVHAKNFKKPEKRRSTEGLGISQPLPKPALAPMASFNGSSGGSSDSRDNSRPSTPAAVLRPAQMPIAPPPRTQPLDIILAARSGVSFAAAVAREIPDIGGAVFADAQENTMDPWMRMGRTGEGLMEYFAVGPKAMDTSLVERSDSSSSSSPLTTDASSDWADMGGAEGELGLGGTYGQQSEFLQRIAHKLLGIESSMDCPVCSVHS